MATPTTPPAGGYVVKTSGWDPVPTVPTTPPAGGYVVRVGGKPRGWHIGSLRFGSTAIAGTAFTGWT